MQQKTLIVTMLAALFLSRAASAEFTEAVDGQFSGNIDFNGTITDTNPIWAWEIPEQSITDAQGWDALVLNGQVNGDKTSFTFPEKSSMPLIRGFMKTPSVSGGAGITPVITIGGGDNSVVLSGDVAQDVTVVATGKNSSNVAVPDGSMSLKAQAFLGGAHDATYFGSTKAQEVLAANQENFATNYPSLTAANQSYAQSEEAFRNQSFSKLSGAYIAEIKDYLLTFPSASLPSTWSAIVPVTVTLK